VTFGLGKSKGRRAWLPVSVQNDDDLLIMLVRHEKGWVCRFHAIAIETRSLVSINFAAVADSSHDDVRVRQLKDHAVIAVTKPPLASFAS
jgi:hypothetical protein